MTTALRATVGCVLALLSDISAAAAQINCVGSISHFWVRSNGDVYIRPSYLNYHMRVCNLTADPNGISSTTCVTWASMLKSAHQRQGLLNIAYSAASSTSPCDKLASDDGAPVPLYIMQFN